MVDSLTLIVVEPPDDKNVTDGEMNHINNVSSTEELSKEQKNFNKRVFQ